MSILNGLVADLAFSGSPGYTGNLMNAVGDKIANFFRLTEAATITTVGVRQTTRVNNQTTPTAAFTGTVRIGIQTVSATDGLNSGTWVGGASNYVDVSSWIAANDAKFVTVTLPSSASLSQGVPYCVVAEMTSYPGSGSLTLSFTFTNTVQSRGYPYNLEETDTTIAKSTNQAFAPWLIRSSSKTYGLPIETFTTTALESDTTPDEIGLGFTLPSGFGSNYTVDGGILTFAFNTTVDVSFTMTLYQGTTALQTTTIDTAQIANVNTSRRYELAFDTALSSLTPGTEYILAVAPSDPSTTNAMTTRDITVQTSGDKSAFGDLNFKYYSRSDGGAWTENTTRIPLFGISIGSVSTTASGGLLVHPGMAGGMRG
jgi:hypothetical protein